MPDNQSKIIEIIAAESKMFDNGGTQFKLKADDGKTYKFNESTKPDAEGKSRPTVAFQQFKDMGLKVGSVVEIWYKEIEKEYQGKPYTDRLIASFKEANSKPLPHPTPAPKAPVKPKYEYSNTPDIKDDKFWDKKAYKQCLWNYWLGKKGDQTPTGKLGLDELALGEMEIVWHVFNQIEKDAEKRFSQDTEPLPTEQGEIDELNF